MTRPLALITGGARRVGRAIALHLAKNGYDIVLTYHESEQQAQQLCAELMSCGRTSDRALRRISPSSPAAWQDLVAAIPDRGRLQAVVNNASIYLPDSAIDSSLPLFAIHCEAPLLLSRLLAPELEANRGCIINMCDILGRRPMPGWLGYCSSKAGLASLTLGLARELSPEIRVCGIAPGVAQWPDGYDEDVKTEYLRRVPLRRAGTPEEVAALVRFLLTEGTYITGQIIAIDGGRSIA